MRKAFVLASLILLYAGLSPASTPEERLDILNSAVIRAKSCGLEVTALKLDSEHRTLTRTEESEKEKRKVLESFDPDDGRYQWMMEKVAENIRVQDRGEGLSITALLPQRADYDFAGITLVELHELKLDLEEVSSDDGWLPKTADLEIHLAHRLKFRPWRWKDVHERYLVNFDCTTRATK